VTKIREEKKRKGKEEEGSKGKVGEWIGWENGGRGRKESEEKIEEEGRRWRTDGGGEGRGCEGGGGYRKIY
jgi:hypothetical protein